MRKIKLYKDSVIEKKIYLSEKGSITGFVLIAMLFFSLTLMGIYAASVNKSNTQMGDTSSIEKQYTVTDEDLELKYMGSSRTLFSVSELYDENNVVGESYDLTALHIGDFVRYDAGVWEKNEVVETAEIMVDSDLQEDELMFLGISEGESKNEYNQDKDEISEIGGWRIFDVDVDTEEITLISTGTIEEYNLASLEEEYALEISQYVISGVVDAENLEFDVEQSYNARDFSVYENEYAKTAKALSKTDLDEWYEKYFGEEEADVTSKEVFDVIYKSENAQYENIVDMGESYFIADDETILKLDDEEKLVSEVSTEEEIGLRILITLKGDVKVNGKEFDQKEIAGKGQNTTYNVWDIAFEDNSYNVNEPRLSTGMIPIKWDGQDWVICAIDDQDWYMYSNEDESKWANVMLSDGRYKYDETALVGTKVSTNDLGSMFVWIPRYGYCVSEYDKKIEIAFLRDSTDEVRYGQTPVWSNESGDGKWNVHPAFSYGDEELRGIWVAKFEVSKNEVDQIKVIPDVTTWRSDTITDMFDSALDMNNKQNAEYYGVESNDSKIDPHMMKNSEWGAVAYLAYSAYGVNSEVIGKNENTSYVSGNGNYVINLSQSTTGNVTGIYDLNGGAHEYVAAYVDNKTYNLQEYGNSLYNAEDKYKDVYAPGTIENPETNYTEAKNLYGDAIAEVSNGYSGRTAWQNASSQMPANSTPFFTRGGCAYGDEASGVFAYGGDYGKGKASIAVGFRVTIVN